jgi:hypothetical protein
MDLASRTPVTDTMARTRAMAMRGEASDVVGKKQEKAAIHSKRTKGATNLPSK